VRRADRLIELAGRLKAKSVVRAEDLASYLEVSVRTIYRDIATLQALGHPIEGQAGVGFMLRGDIHLPPISFDHDELEALALGLAYVEQVGDAKLSAAARAARGKADLVWNAAGAGLLGARAIRSSQRPGHRSPALGAAVRGALRAKRAVRFSYRDAEGHLTERDVHPLALTAYSEGWLLGAWCLTRGDFRTFRLDRMSALSITEPFEPAPGQDIVAYLSRPSRPWAGDAIQTVAGGVAPSAEIR
jgi:predicted DNA-binding transcriptional regulator YafY